MATPSKNEILLTKEQAEEVIRFLEEKKLWSRVIKVIFGMIVGGCGIFTYFGVTKSFWITVLRESIK